jgi:uncharacterized protein (DUF849 family)
MSSGHPVLLTAALVGGGPARGRAPWQPADTTETITAALACEAAGAAILHLHVRDDATGATTTDPAATAALLRALRDAGCRAVLNLSAGDDGGRADHARRIALAGCGAEMVSLAAGSFNAGTRLYDNAPGFQHRQAAALAAVGAVPELEVFDTGQLAGVAALLAAGAIRSPPALCLVFGVPGGMPADAALLRWLVPLLPAGAPWCISAQGDDAAASDALLEAALDLGGHVRTGIEDSRWLSPGAAAGSSAEQVTRWVARAHDAGRRPAMPDEARAMLGLSAAMAPHLT